MVTRFSLILASIATVGLGVLTATSFDSAVRYMGIDRWQRLHNTVYVLTAFALVHYLLSPDVYAEQYLLSGIFFWLMGWRFLNHRGQATGVVALVALAVASCLFTMLLEASWLRIYQGFAFMETIAGNFVLVEDPSPASKVLILGLLVAVVGSVRRASRLDLTGS